MMDTFKNRSRKLKSSFLNISPIGSIISIAVLSEGKASTHNLLQLFPHIKHTVAVHEPSSFGKSVNVTVVQQPSLLGCTAETAFLKDSVAPEVSYNFTHLISGSPSGCFTSMFTVGLLQGLPVI